MDDVSDCYNEVFTKVVELQGKYSDTMIAGNMMNQPFYKKYVGLSQNLPNVEFLQDNSFYVANNPELTENELNLILTCLEV